MPDEQSRKIVRFSNYANIGLNEGENRCYLWPEPKGLPGPKSRPLVLKRLIVTFSTAVLVENNRRIARRTTQRACRKL